jgi:hypothetical protein
VLSWKACVLLESSGFSLMALLAIVAARPQKAEKKVVSFVLTLVVVLESMGWEGVLLRRVSVPQ